MGSRTAMVIAVASIALSLGVGGMLAWVLVDPTTGFQVPTVSAVTRDHQGRPGRADHADRPDP